ncbi:MULTISPECIES: TIGR02452 family protein [Streptomyces]|uniref:TIGR02452 family protein n=1 Tax=Streptomyces TaxID=1883 RepID=UPI001038CB31|nr:MULTISPECIES: TIGR02452 family protein [Streptomyces]MBT3074779.1 TIGR02452 family protein [Streptomyces sp. COG21]MBT3081833.1 TIGR02452 family protein [Streptomyces sp. COG20]MBT3090647.1 TIGR02452 family protein [Streptomyces sp. CYG21]MBT3098098.1 TIGR02452 family protein [Streptomyces sp. CBG30]MBT3105763.1 TIGR02452 family protein [Streptomyces sp. COG19]
MSARLRGIARETEAVVEAGHYRNAAGQVVSIERAVAAARSGTRLYGPEPVPVPAVDTDRTPRFEVTGESSLRAARRLADEAPGKVAVLNYASARNPGGGYLNGAQAQEEALCRGSALHTTLLRAPEYYAHHRAERSAFYTDRVIHSPGVPVFRDDRGRFLDTPYEAGFLTSRAPNAGVIRRQTPEEAHHVPAALAARAERVLEVAAAEGYRRLVLGAWGCGVFRNDPVQVAGAFGALLGEGGRFGGHFDHIVFGILDRTPDSPARAAFTRTFEGGGG